MDSECRDRPAALDAPMTRALLDALPAQACVLDAGGRIVAVNGVWERFAAENCGIPARLGPGVNYLEICRRASADDAEGAAEALAGVADVLAGLRDSFSQEYPCHSPDERRWFLMLAAPLRVAEGGAVITFIDITARKLGEMALHESEYRLRAVVDTAADAIIGIDSRGTIDSFNATAERMFGYGRAEVVGRNVSILMPPPVREAHDVYLARYKPGSPSRIVGQVRQMIGRKKDGTLFPIELSVGRVDSLDLFTGIIRDVSERRAMQEQLLTIAEQEQRRIGQDLHDDVGQDLTGLALMVESLAEALEEADSTESGLADRIRTGLRRVQERVRDLCRGLMPVEVDAEGLMAALEDLAARFSISHGVICRFECRTPVPVEDNRTATHLFRIAQEAVSNAARHGRPRAIVIRLLAEPTAVTLEVRDDGAGLPPGFESGSGPGSGMGLRIMRHRAGLIGATLTLGPAGGSGTLVACRIDREDHDHARRTDPGRHP